MNKEIIAIFMRIINETDAAIYCKYSQFFQETPQIHHYPLFRHLISRLQTLTLFVESAIDIALTNTVLDGTSFPLNIYEYVCFNDSVHTTRRIASRLVGIQI